MRSLAVRSALIVASIAGFAAAQDTPAPVPRPTRAELGVAKDWKAVGTQGAVVAGGSEAVDGGIAVLKGGGNAVDAAVATILAQTVTDANQFCFGGEVPILIFDARRQVVEVIAGQGEAPRLATHSYFTSKPGGIPARGIESAAVPATLDACLTALGRSGTLSFAAVARPALRILDRHEQPWHENLARTLRALIEAESSTNDRQRGLRLAADYFYRGPIAQEVDAWSRRQGGLIRYSDLATHVTRVEEPVAVNYRDYTVYKCGPWTQGPALLQSLELLEGFDLRSMGRNHPDSIHAAVEAIKLAFADRDTYYGDPLFANVPLTELLAARYAAARRDLIDMGHASLEMRPGDPIGAKPLRSSPAAVAGPGDSAHDTTTCLVADHWGNVVAATPSGWSGVLAGDTGIWLGSRLQSLNLQEGHPNVIEPGKRPRITLTPTLVLKGARPALAISVAGGDLQDQVTLQLLLDLIDFDLAPAESVSAPRFSTSHFIGSFRQAKPRLGSLSINPGVGAATIEILRARGHVVELAKPPIAAPSALRLNAATGLIEAAGDPKAGRHAAAF
jgi:gamma-glutamyltranspeptidase/glutathione hydrolase